MKYKKTIVELVYVCDCCLFTAIRKLDKEDDKLYNKFENEEYCKECFNLSEEEKEKRKGKNSLKIDYCYN